MKRILSFVLTLTLLLSLCVFNAAAEGNVTELNSSGPSVHVQMHDGSQDLGPENPAAPTANTIAFRTVVTGDWYAIQLYVGDYDNKDGSRVNVSVYAWDTDYNTTAAGTALRSGIVTDSDGSGYTNASLFTFDSALAAGDYLVVITGMEVGGWRLAQWLCNGATTGVQLWKDGVKDDDHGIMAKLYVNAAAGAGISRQPLTDAPIPVLENPNAGGVGTSSFAHGGGAWNPKTSIFLTGNTIASRVVTTQALNSFALYSSCTASGTAGYIFTVYAWSNTYNETVKTEPLFQWMAQGFKNGAFVNFPFNGELPAGDYLFVASDAFHSESGGTVSLWKSELDTTKAATTYVNGVEADFDVFAWYYAPAASCVASAYHFLPLVNDSSKAPAGAQIKLFNGWGGENKTLYENDVAVRVAADGNYYGLGVYVGANNTTETNGFVATTYVWDTDYATTVAGTPVDQVRVEFIGSGKAVYIKFQNYLPAGNYLTVCSDPYGASTFQSVIIGAMDLGIETQTYVNGEVAATYANAWAFIAGGNATVPARPEAVKYEGYQKSTELVDGKYNIRFIASGSNFDVDAVGFKVTASVDGKSWDVNSKTVYTSILAEGLGEVTAATYGAQYLSTLTVKGVPADTQVTFTVTPYVISEYGTVVYGEAQTVVVD